MQWPGVKTRFRSNTRLPFFYFWVRVVKAKSRKKRTVIMKGLLGNQEQDIGNQGLCVTGEKKTYV